MERKLIDLASQRTAALNAAEAALQSGNQADYSSNMEKVANLNTEIDSVNALISEKNRQIVETAPSAAEAKDIAAERTELLRKGESISFSTNEMIRAFRNSTVVSGTIAQPTGAGPEVIDNIGGCSVLDLVRVQDMTGLGGWDEAYAVADMATAAGAPATTAGTARTAADPTFAISQIKPYEVTTTSFVDRNIARLSPVAYYEKVQAMALRALRNKISALILLGDSESTHVMYGMANGVNKAGTAIYKTSAAAAIDVDLLQTLYFEYGDDLTVGGLARVFMSKDALATIGKLRGTNEKRRLFDVVPENGNPNQGTISDGGMIIPYSVNGGLKGTKNTIIYGDPMNYLLGLFGDYTVRVDESYKAQERLLTVLGDATVGGNIVANNGFVVATI